METHLTDVLRATTAGCEAEAILRRCVHCGFCNATCPTYQLLGDELDGPRGRIYLIKQVLEGSRPTASTRLHLDRCLVCRACESACPSGVEYARLLDIGRAEVERQAPRSGVDAILRGVLKHVLPRPDLFGAALALGRLARPLLPRALRVRVPPRGSAGSAPGQGHARRMIALAGCVQPALYPNINGAARRVLDRLGIALIEAPGAGCCGAVRHHLNATADALEDARRNIDAWWPLLEAGAEGLVMTASGCGVQVREYGHLLREDPRYAARAARVAGATRDIGEVLAGAGEALERLLRACPPLPEAEQPLAFHSPCTLQHGFGLRGTVEPLLTAAGYRLTPVADAHLCCGSAGAYSLLQPAIAAQLRDNKLAALNEGAPAAMASANVGCIAHLQAGAEVPVSHWIELIDRRLARVQDGN